VRAREKFLVYLIMRTNVKLKNTATGLIFCFSECSSNDKKGWSKKKGVLLNFLVQLGNKNILRKTNTNENKAAMGGCSVKFSN